MTQKTLQPSRIQHRRVKVSLPLLEIKLSLQPVTVLTRSSRVLCKQRIIDVGIRDGLQQVLVGQSGRKQLIYNILTEHTTVKNYLYLGMTFWGVLKTLSLVWEVSNPLG
jgi:hypothetical protein